MIPPTLVERIAHVAEAADRAWTEMTAEGGVTLASRPTSRTPLGVSQQTLANVRAVLDGRSAEGLHAFQSSTGLAIGESAEERFAALAPPDQQAYRLFVAIVKTLGCGVERWDVKTGTDPEAAQVVMTPKPSTIAELAAFPAPPPDPPSRVAGEPECQVYTIEATITACKMEADSDYHLALADDQGNTMIAEAACPGCAQGSPWLEQITAARAAIDAAIPNIAEQYQDVGRKVTVTGPGFLDRIHGQRGVAPNGIELHPILSIDFQGAS